MNLHLIRKPDAVEIRTEDGVVRDTSVRFTADVELNVFVQAKQDKVCEVRLRWNEPVETPVRVLGDEWERGYGTMEWRGLVPERLMPWYCLMNNGRETFCAGVKVRPNSFCWWQADRAGVTLVLNVRCGGCGVALNGRELKACTVVTRKYEGISAFEAASRFCGVMCTDPLPVEKPVYGGNNWYYAYGDITADRVREDALYMSELAEGLENRPYMVIDDGWEVNVCGGPWEKGNEKFPDMAGLAAEMAAQNVIPGIWVRYLRDISPEIPEEWRLHGPAELIEKQVSTKWRQKNQPEFLDPSVPAVLEHVGEITRRLSGWGYKLIKHDFSTFDLFGYWGFEMPPMMTPEGWHFADQSKTSAEIILGFYRTILENAGDAKILGCNCIGHLCAGLAHANRIGDDTSGREWERTRKMGVNTLAFRLCQNHRFFEVDADCVGMTEKISWEMNRKWLRLLAESGSPLFISNKRGELSPEQLAELKAAFAAASAPLPNAEPLDWLDNVCPADWLLNGEKVSFDWFEQKERK